MSLHNVCGISDLWYAHANPTRISRSPPVYQKDCENYQIMMKIQQTSCIMLLSGYVFVCIAQYTCFLCMTVFMCTCADVHVYVCQCVLPQFSRVFCVDIHVYVHQCMCM